MTQFTPEYIAELRELAAKATPRPWKCETNFDIRRGGSDNEFVEAWAETPLLIGKTYGDVIDQLTADKDYLEAAANELPSLLDDNDALRSDLTGCRQQLRDAEEREAVALAEVERLTAELSAAPKRAEALQEALEWYADPDHYYSHCDYKAFSDIDNDEGERARVALSGGAK